MAVTERVTQYEVVEAHIESKLIDLHTSMPAIVQSFDLNKKTCVVTPIFYRTLPDGDDNEIPGEPLPDLQDVPICYPRGGGYCFVFPLKAGDEVLLSFSERNIGAWRSTGSAGDPGDLQLHPLDGAIAIPGPASNSKVIAIGDSTTAFIGGETNPASRVHFTASGLELGDGGTHPVTWGDSLSALLNALALAENVQATDVIFAALCTQAASGAATKAMAILAALPTLNSQTTKTI